MAANSLSWRQIGAAGGCLLGLGLSLVLILATARDSKAAAWWPWRGRQVFTPNSCTPECGPPCDGFGGTWYWLHSPEEEKRITMGLFNRYCIRCHGIDGHGVWDIPGVPDFTNPRWQASRSDAQLTRIILEGRGAVMPPFRGTLSLEEACAMARYLRTFLPGTEAARPESGPAEKPANTPQTSAPQKLEGVPKE